jgi:hypothetical protein
VNGNLCIFVDSLLNCRLVQLLPFDYLHRDIDKWPAKAVSWETTAL